jgi:hypothetical protein
MSFLSGIVEFLSGNSIASSLVKVAGMAFVAKKIADSTNASNNTNGTANIDQGVRLQIPPAADSKIPVLYGNAFFGGNITDAVMTNTNKTMWYCLTLSEKTGTLLSTGDSSVYTYKDIYWNKQRINFKSNGITVDHTTDSNGNVDNSLNDLVEFYCFAGDSTKQVIPTPYSNPNKINAYDLIPGWTSSTHMMNDLIFAICKVTYNKDKNVTGLGEVLFNIDNTMKLPGDVLNDYMTNTRYGAGIPSTEVYSQ